MIEKRGDTGRTLQSGEGPAGCDGLLHSSEAFFLSSPQEQVPELKGARFCTWPWTWTWTCFPTIWTASAYSCTMRRWWH